MKPWRKRLNIAVDIGSPLMAFVSRSGLTLAFGYNRVVIGKRGPYVEFTQSQIVWDSFKIPDGQEYRLNDDRVFYLEYRSTCASNVMLYFQKKTVSYADYKIHHCYIAPADLLMLSTCPVLSP